MRLISVGYHVIQTIRPSNRGKDTSQKASEKCRGPWAWLIIFVAPVEGLLSYRGSNVPFLF